MSRRKEDVKIAGLWKRSQNLSMFTKPNYKHRVFILTGHSLSYYSGTTDVSVPFSQRASFRQQCSQTDCRMWDCSCIANWGSRLLYSVSADHMYRLSPHAACWTVEGTSGHSVRQGSGVRGRECVWDTAHAPGKLWLYTAPRAQAAALDAAGATRGRIYHSEQNIICWD